MQKPLCLVLCLLFSIQTIFSKQLIIIINPAGDSKKTGRKLHNSYERAQTLRCAQELQKILQQDEQKNVILTRNVGQEIIQWQNASFSNRLHADLFISLHIAKHQKMKPIISLFQLVFDPTGDFIKRAQQPHNFIPAYQAHLPNTQHIQSTLKNLKSLLSTEHYTALFECHGPYCIPIKPLIGIQARLTFAIEIAVANDEGWKPLLQELANALNKIL